MPRYQIGDETFHRKHLWLPCIIGDRMDDMTPAEQAAAFKATWWAQNITNAEWPALLGHEGASKYARSRLKRKVVGWLMAMGRIAALNPKLYNQAVNEALALYEQQLGQPHPMFRSHLDEVADGPHNPRRGPRMRELTVAGGRRQARYAAEEAIDDGAGVRVRAVYCDRRLIL